MKKKPLGNLEDEKEIEEKIKKDSRSQVINKTIASDLKQKYDVKDNEAALSYFNVVLDSTYFSNNWEIKPNFKAKMPFLSIKEVSYDAQDFADYLKLDSAITQMCQMDFKVLCPKNMSIILKINFLNIVKIIWKWKILSMQIS